MLIHTIIIALIINWISCQQSEILDCSVFAYDYDIVGTFPFFVPFNPRETAGKSYAMMNTLNEAIELVIYKQDYVPIDIFCFRNLRVLKIIDTPFSAENIESRIYKVPDYLRNLQNLQTLVIENSNVGGNFTNALTQLSSLIELRIINSSLKHLPPLGSHTRLSILDIQKNPINQLFQTENLHFITYVRLAGCAFTSLPKFTVLSGKCHTYCSSTPSWHQFYPQFTHLNISGSQFNQIFDINRYKTLQEFDGSYNKIQFLPPSISEVPNLKKLWMNNNKLVYVSEDIFKLKNLELANFANNSFPPSEISELRSAFLNNLPKANVTF